MVQSWFRTEFDGGQGERALDNNRDVKKKSENIPACRFLPVVSATSVR